MMKRRVKVVRNVFIAMLLCLKLIGLETEIAVAETLPVTFTPSTGWDVWASWEGTYAWLPQSSPNTSYSTGGYTLVSQVTRRNGVELPYYYYGSQWLGTTSSEWWSAPAGTEFVTEAVLRRTGGAAVGLGIDGTVVAIGNNELVIYKMTTIKLTNSGVSPVRRIFSSEVTFPLGVLTTPPREIINTDSIMYIDLWLASNNWSTVPPVITNIPNIQRPIGTTADWTAEIAGHWGHTTTNTIPLPADNGTVELATGQTPIMNIISSNGLTFDRIGVATLNYIMRDAHSLSSHPFFAEDTTSTTGTRSITVTTTAAPTVATLYASGSVDRNGFDVSGSIYSTSDLISPCGGEDGWTNQLLDIRMDPSSIPGTYSTVLQIPTIADVVVPNGMAIAANYNLQTSLADVLSGTPVTGFLSELGNVSNRLSGIATGNIKVDITPPVADATNTEGFTFTEASSDDLSGISTVGYPTQIAFTLPSASMTPPTAGWEDMDSHTMTTSGTYDVWVRATDKAGNVDTRKIYASTFVGGEVAITKDTNLGAVLHTFDCANAGSISVEATCELECSMGTSAAVLEATPLTYIVTLTNRGTSGNASGTFEDYLPEGVDVTGTLVVTPAGSATVTAVMQTTGPYTGRYLVSGTYTSLSSGASIQVEIPTQTPMFDSVNPAANVFSNQASTTWTIGAGSPPLTGTNLSNYANHAVAPPGVETIFTKVAADELSTGLAGAEFALYRWEGAFAPTLAERNHMVDVSMLVDNTQAGGDWVRVTYDGEDATSISDNFISKATPQGEVDFGRLEEGIYTLIETKAPTGYALPIGQWILTIDSSANDSGASDWKIEFAGKSHSIMPPAVIRDESVPNAPTYQLINARPFLIGMSGLEGTTGMLLTGFVIMALAANIYFIRRYKQKEK